MTFILFATWFAGNQLRQIQAVKGIGYSKIQAKLEKLQEENLRLEAEILEYSSFHYIAGRAAQLGYTDGKVINLYDKEF